MISSLNLMKPVSKYEKAIAVKCGWNNAASLPVRKNVIPEGFVGSAKLEPAIPVIGTKLSPNNVAVMEIIMGSDKISRSPFVRTNMTEMLKMANTPDGSKMIQKILTEENVDKLDTIRTFVRNNPRAYVKDKSQVKYVNSPAGLSALFNDISMLKAAAILDKDELKTLFKMDVTCGEGKKVLDSIGKMTLEQVDIAQKSLKESAKSNFLS